MNATHARLRARAARFFVLASLALLAGCTTNPAMKGSPFYTGEFKQKPGPAEERVPAWPLFYYRDPVLSVCWPIFESVRGESLAVRPLYSTYDLDDPAHREWNALWPLIQGNPGKGTGRAVPFFWGDDYLVGFPLYWRFTGADRVSDLFIPLWWYNRDAMNWHFASLLGLVGASKSPASTGWHVFPVYGSYDHPNGGYHRFEMLLAHQYESPGGLTHVNTLLPLWWYDRDPSSHRFFSPLWMQGASRDGESWKFLLPVFLSRQAQDSSAFYTLLGGGRSSSNSTGWVAPVLLSGGSRDPDRSSDWFVWPLSHFVREGTNSTSHVFPLYYASENEEGRRFLSLPWSDVRHADGSNWQLVPPLYYRGEDTGGTLTLSPFYFANHAKTGTNDWRFIPPVYFHQEDGDGSRTLTPLYSHGESRDGQSAWDLLVPFYYAEHDHDGRLIATLLGGHRSGADGDAWMVYPLLTWNSRHGSTNDFWALAPLAHFHREPDGDRSHVFPLYYRNAASRTFLSLPYSRWSSGDATHVLIPPLLTLRTEREHASDLWMLAGLGRYSSGEDARASYLFPVFYDNPRTGTLLSPFYCSWTSAEGRSGAIPPLLGMMSESRTGTRDLWALAGLFHHERDREGRTLSHHLAPLYFHSPSNYFYTALFGSKGDDEDGMAYYLTPLLGSSRHHDESSFWLFPLYSRTVDASSGDTRGHVLWGSYRNAKDRERSSFFPLWSHERTADAASNLYERTSAALWLYGDKHTESAAGKTDSSHLFPFWSHDGGVAKDGATTNKTALLLALYDTKRTGVPAAGGTNEYTRKRVLWHVWHYENMNGDVSMDLLPGIAYDRKKDGFHQFSILWRLFRWQRDAEGKRKLDLLFVPLIRDSRVDAEQ